MTKLLALIGSVVGGYGGWAIGAPFGIFAAFVVSMIGTGIGLYAGRRIAQHYGG